MYTLNICNLKVHIKAVGTMLIKIKYAVYITLQNILEGKPYTALGSDFVTTFHQVERQSVPVSLSSYLIFDGVRGVLLLLALLVWPADIQILHVGGQHLGHADARQDAHDWSQNQHQTHLTREQPAVH